MDTETRIKQLIEANNRNIEKRRALTRALRDVLNLFPLSYGGVRETLQKVIDDNGPS